jgi:hypothetical protein
MTPDNPLDHIDIPGLLEVRTRNILISIYHVWVPRFKENIKKAHDIALDNCLDLKQIYGETQISLSNRA